jgi:hypothetical protein
LNFSLPFIGGLFAYLGFKKEKVLASLLHHKESYTPTISKEKFSTTSTLKKKEKKKTKKRKKRKKKRKKEKKEKKILSPDSSFPDRIY